MSFLGQYLDILMFITLCALLLSGFPVAFVLAGTSLLFALIGMALGVFDSAYLFAMPQRIFGSMTNEVLLAVPLFIFMGVMLEKSRVAEELLETMAGVFGKLRGGLGYSVLIVGALLAASTGIVGATVVTMGLISLPTMLRNGYSPQLATGIVAASGTLGQIIPPSIVLVILGDQISTAYQQAQLASGSFSPDSVSVGDLFAGALLPGLCLVGLYFVYLVVRAIFWPATSPALAQTSAHRVTMGKIVRVMIPPVALIIAVLGSIIFGVATPTEAAALGATGAVILAGYRFCKGRRWPIHLAVVSIILLLVLSHVLDMRISRDVIESHDLAGIFMALGASVLIILGLLFALRSVHRSGVLNTAMRATGQITAMVFAIMIAASLFSLVFRGLGGEELVHSLLSDLPGGAMGAMIIVMLVMFLMGFFLDFLEIVFIIVPIVAPVLLMMEMPDGSTMSPVWLAVMIAVNLQTSFLTPPFGFALFYLRGVSPPEVTTLQIYQGVAPFVGLQLFALIILWFFPALATWLPQAML